MIKICCNMKCLFSKLQRTYFSMRKVLTSCSKCVVQLKIMFFLEKRLAFYRPGNCNKTCDKKSPIVNMIFIQLVVCFLSHIPCLIKLTYYGKSREILFLHFVSYYTQYFKPLNTSFTYKYYITTACC